MARDDIDNSNESMPDWRPPKRWLAGGLAQALVMVNGLILTIAAYVILSMFIQSMMDDDLKRLVWDAQNKVSNDIGGLEHTLRSASTILITSRPLGDEAVRKNVLYGVPELDRFERVFWLRRKDGTKTGDAAGSRDNWMMIEIMKQPISNEAAAGVAISDEVLKEHVLSVYNKANERVIVSSEIPGTRYVQEYVQPVMRSRPFVMVQPRPGLLLLWESWLRHEVLPGTGRGERLSVSFNFA